MSLKPIHLLAAGLLAPCLLHAQVPQTSYALKIGAGLTAGSFRSESEANKAITLGLEAARAFHGGALSLELGFDYIPGKPRDVMPQGGQVYYNPKAPTATYAGQALRLSTATSIDWRKESVAGFSLKGGYSAPLDLGLEGLTWKAGLSLDFHRVSSEFSGTLIPVYGAGAGTAVPGLDPVDPAKPAGPMKDYYEGWAFNHQRSSLGLGAFAGLGYAVDNNIRAEVTLRNLPYTHQDYRPFTYTGRAAERVEKHSRGFLLQFGLSLKL